ncbi:MAG TPA: ABC transporter substrate-binding protein [Candidatus Acidoferrales bacterium]|nr:ABC transporter substrate-binding protein [Candidatus Acidoferrales bacterium]
MRVWERAIAIFEAQNPGTKVVLELGPHSSTEFHDLVTQKLRNRDPSLDVFFMDVIWPPEFVAAGWALPLDSYFPVAEREKFLRAPIVANTYRGRIYGAPVFVDASMLYYRKDLLQKYGFAPPATWPELVRQAQTILERENDPSLSGFSGQFKQYEGLVCNMMEYIMSNGGALVDETGLTSALDEPKARAAVRFVRDKIVGEIGRKGMLAYQEPESLAVFAQGKAVFHRNWPYAWEISNDPRQSKVSGAVGLSPLPYFPGGRSVSTLGGWQLAISRFSRQPELAWKFIAVMTGEQVQKEIALAMGRGPGRARLYRDPEVLEKNPQFAQLVEIVARAVPRPRTPVYAPLSNIMQRYFSAAIAVPDSNIEQLARIAARDMNRVLDLLRDHAQP